MNKAEANASHACRVTRNITRLAGRESRRLRRAFPNRGSSPTGCMRPTMNTIATVNSGMPMTMKVVR